MSKELVIKCCKCTLVLNENELFNGLDPEILYQAIKRGKGYKRAEAVEKRSGYKLKITDGNETEKVKE